MIVHTIIHLLMSQCCYTALPREGLVVRLVRAVGVRLVRAVGVRLVLAAVVRLLLVLVVLGTKMDANGAHQVVHRDRHCCSAALYCRQAQLCGAQCSRYICKSMAARVLAKV